MTVHQHSGFSHSTSFAAQPHVPPAAIFLALVAPALLSLLLFNAAFVLPSLSIISLAVAGMVALLAWATASKPDGAHITLWDLSGLYAFVGFAAGMLSEPEHIVELWSLPPGDHDTAR